MHDFGRFLQQLMDQERMTQADLARRSGLSRQLVNTLVSGDSMKQLPHRSTFDGLRSAFPGVPYSTLVLRAAAAIGIPVESEPPVDYTELSNESLLGILARRLEGANDGWQPEAQKIDDDPIAVTTRDKTVLSARRAPSEGKLMKAEADRLGEESQDDGEWHEA